MSCRIFFVRHGQSIGNLVGRFLGITDLNISELGHKQAERTAHFLNKENIDALYSSDLIRAYNTAVPLAKLKGLDIIKDKGLREIVAGEWENTPFDELVERYTDEYAKTWINDIGFAKPVGGESVAELSDRVYDTVKRIAEQNNGKTVAIFTHATPIRAFFCKIYGKTLAEMKNVPWATNASVSEAVFENGVFKPIRYSYDEFMGEISTGLPKNC